MTKSQKWLFQWSKVDPRDVAAKMPTERTVDGIGYRFEPTELLTWQQIASYWSGISQRTRKAAMSEDEAVIEGNQLTEVSEQLYITEENLETTDNIIDQVSAHVKKQL